MLSTPVLVRSPKLSSIEPSQYLGGWPPGNTRCRKLFATIDFLKADANIISNLFWQYRNYFFIEDICTVVIEITGAKSDWPNICLNSCTLSLWVLCLLECMFVTNQSAMSVNQSVCAFFLWAVIWTLHRNWCHHQEPINNTAKMNETNHFHEGDKQNGKSFPLSFSTQILSNNDAKALIERRGGSI